MWIVFVFRPETCRRCWSWRRRWTADQPRWCKSSEHQLTPSQTYRSLSPLQSCNSTPFTLPQLKLHPLQPLSTLQLCSANRHPPGWTVVPPPPSGLSPTSHGSFLQHKAWGHTHDTHVRVHHRHRWASNRSSKRTNPIKISFSLFVWMKRTLYMW